MPLDKSGNPIVTKLGELCTKGIKSGDASTQTVYYLERYERNISDRRDLITKAYDRCFYPVGIIGPSALPVINCLTMGFSDNSLPSRLVVVT